MAKKYAKGIKWNLSDLYKTINDPQIEKDKKWITESVQKYIKKYKGKISSKSLTAKLMKSSLDDQEKITDKIYIYIVYATLIYEADSIDTKISKFYKETEEFYTSVVAEMQWFDVEWLSHDEKFAKKIYENPLLKNYKYPLTVGRQMKPYTLSEKEEVIMAKQSQVSSNAFTQLFDKIDSQKLYRIYMDGKYKEVSFSELAPILKSHPDQKVRSRAAKALTKGLAEDKLTRAHILNTLLLDSKVEDEIRGFEYPQKATFLKYEIEKETVEAMVSAIQNRYEIQENFYNQKKKLLRRRKLTELDRYTPVQSGRAKKYTWKESEKTILKSFTKFDKEFATISKEFIDKEWIDAEITKGKSGGAFCMWCGPNNHPYVLTNYTGEEQDVMTLAHELGHGIHGYLGMGKGLNYSTYSTSTTVAEVASIFCEMLVFEDLFENAKTKKEKINLLGGKLQDSFATVFRQTAFYLFETDLHNHRREKGELSIDEINGYWQKRVQDTFGKSLTLSEDHKLWWMYVSHFYHYNFYVFTYAFGELLTLALFAKYKEQGESFVKNYKEALALRGSMSPYDLTKLMGVDINDPDFWNGGLDLLDGYVNDFIELSSK